MCQLKRKLKEEAPRGKSKLKIAWGNISRFNNMWVSFKDIKSRKFKTLNYLHLNLIDRQRIHQSFRFNYFLSSWLEAKGQRENFVQRFVLLFKNFLFWNNLKIMKELWEQYKEFPYTLYQDSPIVKLTFALSLLHIF